MSALFTKKLLRWNAISNTRAMPWKGEKDPYRIWLSEIILQQTRVDQGLRYYEKFISHYPTIHDLARATDQEVFKLWEGLGYYSRCKNLIETARKISAEMEGVFPNTFESINSLKGIGTYTASAIASFAYNLPYAVLDGNVGRVLSRYFGISTPVDTADGKKLYVELAEALLDVKKSGLYNQAIMDFGAVICKPQIPLCDSCVQNSECEAFKNNWVDQLPVKKKALQRKKRWFYYFLIEHAGQVYIKKRIRKDIWENLYEFFLHERLSAMELTGPESIRNELRPVIDHTLFDVVFISPEYRQQLTHQTIIGQFVHVKLHGLAPLLDNEYQRIAVTDLKHFPFPRFITGFLQEVSLV